MLLIATNNSHIDVVLENITCHCFQFQDHIIFVRQCGIGYIYVSIVNISPSIVISRLLASWM